ncbi:extensin family protein [Chondromyces apiculatus]|uniref:Alginate regulatory protein AlgP n=1 Tax=Chondromyces apiculatus DSM 436 TaxID=1192034 RepID=A0A017T6X6_9BACT|nr:extensin family protein [Chondromyces apiculatus]EYF04767.1 alginate regulatory protein AlgP [Chondromyces apiculatus DSM 436]
MQFPRPRSAAALLTAALALAASTLGSAEASASSPFLVVPDPAVAEASAAYRYANMTNEEAFAELDRRQIPHERVDNAPGVRAPIRLTGRLHGVYIHSSLPLEQRATTMFEILDARLALSLDDFAALLERHDIDEVVHYTMYRPNVSPPGHAHSIAQASPHRATTGAAPHTPSAGAEAAATKTGGQDAEAAPGAPGKAASLSGKATAKKPKRTGKAGLTATRKKPAATRRTSPPQGQSPAKASPLSRATLPDGTANDPTSSAHATVGSPAPLALDKAPGQRAQKVGATEATSLREKKAPTTPKPTQTATPPEKAAPDPGTPAAKASKPGAEPKATTQRSEAAAPAPRNKPAASRATGKPDEAVNAAPKGTDAAPKGTSAAPKGAAPKRTGKHQEAATSASSDDSVPQKADRHAAAHKPATKTDDATAAHKPATRTSDKAPAARPDGTTEAERAATAPTATAPAAVHAPAAPVKPRPKWAPPGTRHPAGLAIDVGGLRKRDGTWLSVAHHFGGHRGERTCGATARTPERSEARELRAIACEAMDQGIFTYTLTPNYDVAHADHFHMEIKPGVRWFLVH